MTGGLPPGVAALGLGVGLLLALVCYLVTSLSPGGMITPGWLALTLVEDYRRASMVVLVTALTYAGTLAMSRATILYGKRLFAAVVLTGVLLSVGALLLVQNDYPLLFAHQTLGFVVPGLIAYQLIRQPPGYTALTTAVVTAASYGVLLSGVLAGAVAAV